MYFHCISRIVGGAALLDGAKEKDVLWRMMEAVADFSGVRILTRAVMSNHFHLLVAVPASVVLPDEELVARYRILYGVRRSDYMLDPEELVRVLQKNDLLAKSWRRRLQNRMHSVAFFMKTLKQRFAVWYNRTHDRFGALWAERYKCVLVEGSVRALTTVSAYIDLNPVRAGMVDDPAEYRWCGYAEAMAGIERAMEGINLLWGTERDWEDSLAAYRMILFGKGSEGIAGRGRISPDRTLAVVASGGRVDVSEILRCRVRYFSDGGVIGSPAFVQAWFDANRSRHWAESPRTRGPNAMRGADWGELSVLRGLRTKVFG